MADPTFDQLSASTLADMVPDVVWDEFFVEGALPRKLRASGTLDEYLGGTYMQEPFQFNRVQGGAHAPGQDNTVLQVPILAAAAFTPKYYREILAFNLWQNNVINAGPAARVKLTDLYISNAVQSLNTDLNIDIYRHGQASPSGVGDNRVLFVNGASEFMNDGVTSSWDGNYFPYIGGQARNAAIGNVLNSIPYWFGDQNGVPSQIAFKPLLEMYLDCVNPPELVTTNKAAWAYLAERMDPKQGLGPIEKDVSIGMSGIKFMDSYIMVDKLCPSTKFGAILPSGLSQTTAVTPTVFTTSPSPAANSNLPAATLLSSVGEVIFMFRTSAWKVRPVADDEFNFSLTPPIRGQLNPVLVTQFLQAGINFYTVSCRDNKHGYGIGF